MADSRIADLHAALTWDLSDFERGTGEIENTFGRLKDRALALGETFVTAGKRMTMGITVPLAAAAAGGSVALRGMAQDAKDLYNSAKLAGEGFEDFQRQAHAARDVGIESEKLGDIFKDTRDKLGDFIATGQGEMADFFEKIAPKVGVTADMFRELGGKDALQLYYDSLVKAGVGSSEMVFYLEAIADEATGLIPLLAENGKLFDELGSKATVITPEQREALEAYRKSMERVGFAMREFLLAIVDSGLLEMLTGMTERFANFVRGLADTNPEMIRFAAQAALVAAAIGPVLWALTSLALMILPLFLVKLGPVFVLLSAIINPLGTLVIVLSKLAGGFVGAMASIGNIIPFILRLVGLFITMNPYVAAAIAIFLLFKDEIVAALSAVWDMAKEVLGDSLKALMAAVNAGMAQMREAFDRVAQSPLGQFIGKVMDILGQLVAVLVTIGGAAVVAAFNIVIQLITLIIQWITDAVEVTSLLLTGQWSQAWSAAGDMVGNMINGLLPFFQNLWSWIELALVKLGLMEERAIEATNRARQAQNATAGIGGSAVTADQLANGNLKPLDEIGGGKRTAGVSVPTIKSGGGAQTPTRTPTRSVGRTGRTGRTGPSAEELAERREELKLEREIVLVRERGDLDELRRLERKRDAKALIERYERTGLSDAAAKLAAEKDLAELDQARFEARDKALGVRRADNEYQIAELNNDIEHLRYLDDEEDLAARILELQRDGWLLAEAETIAAAEMLQIEEARAAAAARRLHDMEAAHQIELARLRGDTEMANAMEDQRRLDDRVAELVENGGMSRPEAIEQAMREGAERSRAALQGTFRDTFRAGLRAALDGDLMGFFKNWLENASFDALAKVLDRLADRLADLAFGSSGGGGGGLLGTVLGGLLGGGGGGFSPTSSAFDIGTALAENRVPGFASGGSFKIKGFAGVDRNLLSLNGTPIAKVGQGEIMDIRKGEPGGGSVLAQFAPAQITISADGADPAQLQRLENEVRALNDNLEERAIRSVIEMNQRTYGAAFAV